MKKYLLLALTLFSCGKPKCNLPSAVAVIQEDYEDPNADETLSEEEARQEPVEEAAEDDTDVQGNSEEDVEANTGE